ncbi:hypothetical protein L7F22_034193 [Adiantum nelumboides]|nr:hypothetical protein [Adiantum nelumboides]
MAVNRVTVGGCGAGGSQARVQAWGRTTAGPGEQHVAGFRASRWSAELTICVGQGLQRLLTDGAGTHEQQGPGQRAGLRFASQTGLARLRNHDSQAMVEALGRNLTNKKTEGMHGARLYYGDENIDFIENLCIEQALRAFHFEPSMGVVNVQPY